MGLTDPIADMLTRIRNASRAGHEKVDIPASHLKEGITKVLKSKGYIKGYRFIEDRKQGILRVYMRYGRNRERVITGLQRISTPGRRVTSSVGKLPVVLGGAGIAIISTPKGVLADEECRNECVGGEVLCYVW